MTSTFSPTGKGNPLIVSVLLRETFVSTRYVCIFLLANLCWHINLYLMARPDPHRCWWRFLRAARRGVLAVGERFGPQSCERSRKTRKSACWQGPFSCISWAFATFVCQHLKHRRYDTCEARSPPARSQRALDVQSCISRQKQLQIQGALEQNSCSAV